MGRKKQPPKYLDSVADAIAESAADQGDEKPRYNPLDHMDIPKYQSMRKYDGSWMPERAFDLMCQGWSQARVCAELGISGDTLHRWKKNPDYSALSDAIKDGRKVGHAYWEAIGKEAMWDGDINLGVNFIMVMRNQYGQMTRDPDKAQETAKELMADMKAVRSGGKVTMKEWTKTMIKRSG